MKYFLTACALALLLCMSACAGTITEYSAEYQDAETGEFLQRVFVSGEKSRMEFAKKFDVSFVILRPDQGKIYAFLTPTRYVFLPVAKTTRSLADLAGFGVMSVDSTVTRSLTGRGSLHGYDADIVHTVFRMEARGETHTIECEEWMAPEFDMPLRYIHEGRTYDMVNIQPGPQAASLFEIPAGATLLEDMQDEITRALNNELSAAPQ